MKLISYILLVFLFTFSGSLLAAEDEIKMFSQVRGKSFSLGKPFSYVIMVNGTDNVKAPDMKEIKDFSVKLVNAQSIISKKSKGYALQYLMVPGKAGELEIPPIEVVAKGRKLWTQSHKIKIQIPEQTQNIGLSIGISPEQCFIGQPVNLDFYWYSALPFYAFRGVQIDLPVFHNKAFRVMDTLDAARAGDKMTIGLPVSNTRIIAKLGQTQIDGKKFEHIRFSKILIPQKVGDLEITPATLLASYLPPKAPANKKRRRKFRPQYPSYFNNNFFETTTDQNFKRFFAKSQARTLKVMPLPEQGRPVDFYGLLGKCDIEVLAKPLKLHIGDTLTLTITVSNHSFPTTVSLPDLARKKAFSSSFSIAPRPVPDKILDKDKVFTRTIRPLRLDIKNIPPIRIPYFDPETKTYGVASSKPIPIKVMPEETVSSFDAELSGDRKLTNQLLPNKQGIRHNVFSAENALSANRTQPLNTFIWLLIIPPILFILVFAVSYRHRLAINDPAAAKARYAAARFKSKLKNIKLTPAEEALVQIDDIFRTYFSEKLDLLPYAHTADDLCEILKGKGIPAEDLEKIKTVYGACDVKRYKNVEPKIEISQLLQTATESVRNMEKKC